MTDEQFQKRKDTIYQFLCDDLYTPMKIKEIAILLQIPRENRQELQEVLDVLVEEGKVELSKRGKYSKAEPKYLTGIYTGHARGFGFVTVEGEPGDIYIPEEETGEALHQDTVQVEVLSRHQGKRREGRIVKVLARGFQDVIGTFERSKNYGFVIPDNLKISRDIFVRL